MRLKSIPVSQRVPEGSNSVRIGRIALGALIAFVVSVICLLPPGIHFVTGPIGPAIGGYVAGSRLKLNGPESAVVGLAMGIAIAVTLVVSFEYLAFMPDLAAQASIPLSIVGALYIGLLGGVGCWFASRGR
jgi:tetrahydromethanopterin S-methyltransferase subunit F